MSSIPFRRRSEAACIMVSWTHSNSCVVRSLTKKMVLEVRSKRNRSHPISINTDVRGNRVPTQGGSGHWPVETNLKCNSRRVWEWKRMKESVRCLNKMCPRSFSYIEDLGLVRGHCCGKVISEITVFLGMGYPRRVLFGFFRTADLGHQYDTVPRVGGNFYFYSTHSFFCVSHSA